MSGSTGVATYVKLQVDGKVQMLPILDAEEKFCNISDEELDSMITAE